MSVPPPNESLPGLAADDFLRYRLSAARADELASDPSLPVPLVLSPQPTNILTLALDCAVLGVVPLVVVPVPPGNNVSSKSSTLSSVRNPPLAEAEDESDTAEVDEYLLTIDGLGGVGGRRGAGGDDSVMVCFTLDSFGGPTGAARRGEDDPDDDPFVAGSRFGVWRIACVAIWPREIYDIVTLC
jgi:hypothetical protein